MPTERWGENTADDYNSRTEDCQVRDFHGSNLDGNRLQVGDEDDVDHASFIRFTPKQDISGAVITSATLNLYQFFRVGNHNVSVYRVLQNWVESQIKYDIYSTGNSWNSNLPFAANDSGVDDGSFDRHATALDTILLNGGSGYKQWDITSLVQDWVDGDAKEYGVMLFSDNSTSENRVRLYSKDDGADGFRPYLEINYSIATTTSSTTTSSSTTQSTTSTTGIPIVTGINWSSFQLVGDLGDEGTWDTQAFYAAMALIDGSTYKMYYSGLSGGQNQILYADSPDGINFSNHQQVVPKNSLSPHDTNSAFRPCVIKDGSTWRMWYGGFSNVNVWSIIYCDSADGITWTNFQQVITPGSEGTFDTTHAAQPWVVKEPTGFRVYYAGFASGVWSIISATSSDGITWSGFQRVIAPGTEGTYDISHVLYPSVHRGGSIYTMLYAGQASGVNRILFANSFDGVNWSNHQLSIDINEEGTFDTIHSTAPGLLWDTTDWIAYYSGNNGSWRTLYASGTNATTSSTTTSSVSTTSSSTFSTGSTSTASTVSTGSTSSSSTSTETTTSSLSTTTTTEIPENKAELIKLIKWYIRRFRVPYLTLEKAMDLEEDEIRLVPLDSFSAEDLGRMWHRLQEILLRDYGVRVDRGRIFRLRI